MLNFVERHDGETAYEVCPEGSISDDSTAFCCPESCETCGGFGCHLRDGGEKNCCTSQISDSCDSSDPPCKSTIVVECPNNGIMSYDGKFCCLESCEECVSDYLNFDWDDECNINLITELCSNGNLPCLIELETGECPLGGITDMFKNKCCAESCGQCGGPGCHLRPGGEDACCVENNDTSCSDNTFPCAIEPDPTINNAELYCSDGIIATFDDSYFFNVCQMSVCCPSSCEWCDTSEDCSLSPECCAYNFLPQVLSEPFHTTSCRYHDPPCYIPPDDSLCNNDICPDGVKCGEIYTYESEGTCNIAYECGCEEIGNDAGQFCQIPCEDEETPCGGGISFASYLIVVPPSECCPPSKECIRVDMKRAIYDLCYYKERPTTCDPDPCLNGGHCYNDEIYSPEIFRCDCEEGFTGGFCEEASV